MGKRLRADEAMPTKRNRTKCPSTGKVRYRDHHEATLSLKNMRRARTVATLDGVPTNRREDRSYKCPDCKGWHLTSQKSQVYPVTRMTPVNNPTQVTPVTLIIPRPTDLPVPARLRSA